MYVCACTYIPTYIHTYVPAYIHTYIHNLYPCMLHDYTGGQVDRYSKPHKVGNRIKAKQCWDSLYITLRD